MTINVTLNEVADLTVPTTAEAVINNNNDTITNAFYVALDVKGDYMQGPLDMNGFPINNLPAPSTLASPLRLTDLNEFNGGGTISAGLGSVGLTLPADFTVTNSPLTVNGTIAATWANTPTGTGGVVRQTGATLVTPALGVPASGTLTNCTGLPTSGLTGTLNSAQFPALTGDVTTTAGSTATTLATVATGATVGSGNAIPVVTFNNKGLVTSATTTAPTPAVGNITGLGTGVGTFLATPNSANLAGAVTDGTGSGANVWATSPTLVTPTIGVATATSINKVAITAPSSSATLTIANGKTLTANNTLTLAGTDSTTMTFPTTSATIARTDAGNAFTGNQTATGSFLSSSPSAGVGYTTGAGGSVTQLTSKGTSVTLNKMSGAIITSNAALAANTVVSFLFNNSSIFNGDTVFVNVTSGFASNGTYQAWAESVGIGSCVINIKNISAGSLSEALTIGFGIFKGSTS